MNPLSKFAQGSLLQSLESFETANLGLEEYQSVVLCRSRVTRHAQSQYRFTWGQGLRDMRDFNVGQIHE